MNEEQAKARLNEIEDQITVLENERERIAREHNLVIYGSDPHASATFFPSREAFMEEYSYDEDDMEWADQEFDFPLWVSSSEMC